MNTIQNTKSRYAFQIPCNVENLMYIASSVERSV